MVWCRGMKAPPRVQAVLAFVEARATPEFATASDHPWIQWSAEAKEAASRAFFRAHTEAQRQAELADTPDATTRKRRVKAWVKNDADAERRRQARARARAAPHTGGGPSES